MRSPTWLALIALAAPPAWAQPARPQADFIVRPGPDSLALVQKQVRRLLGAQPARRRPVTVLLRGGTYPLGGPLVFGPEDSGTATAPVVYAAYPGETPVLSGGARLTGWTLAPSGGWQRRMGAREPQDFAQLWVGGARRSRPRLPTQGYDRIKAGVGDRKQSFGFAPGDLRADWKNLRDVEVHVFHNWTSSHLRVATVDAAAGRVSFTAITHPSDIWALDKGKRFLVENVREALSLPGQWYLDRPAGLLTYLPRPGEDPETADVVAPRLEHLLEIRGDVAGRRWVSHLHFRGLFFAHTQWVTPPGGHTYPQAEADLPAAITATGARGCVFDACTVAHTGAWAMEWLAGCQNDRVQSCRMTDMGGGGVKIDSGEIRFGEYRPRPPDEEAGRITVRDCLIAHGGRLHPGAEGVWIGHSSGNRIERNTITDFYHNGISVGWVWHYGPSGSEHNTIADNHIFRLGQGVLGDLGGIYTLGEAPGTVLRHNRIHDLTYSQGSNGAHGIYLDQGSSGITVTDNLVYRAQTSAYFQWWGKDNEVRNNVFALSSGSQLELGEHEGNAKMAPRPVSSALTGNIVFYARGTALNDAYFEETVPALLPGRRPPLSGPGTRRLPARPGLARVQAGLPAH